MYIIHLYLRVCVFSQGILHFLFISSHIFSSLFSHIHKTGLDLVPLFKFSCYCYICHLTVNKRAVAQIFCWAFCLSSYSNCLPSMTTLARMRKKCILSVRFQPKVVLLNLSTFMAFYRFGKERCPLKTGRK